MSIADTFPKRYEPKLIEKKNQDFWGAKRKQLYAFDPNSTKPIFSIDTPPPTVSGKLHIGHVFSYTHTEIISRYKRMRGFNVYYPFGYDDNGLPTEILTEKDNGIKSYQTDRAKFRELCRQTGTKYSALFKDLWQAMGFTCDFDTAYSTISDSSRKISQWSFVDLYKKNKLERRKEPALWCTTCTTSFAQAEIDDVNQASQFIHFSFEVEGLAPIQIASTRPELLCACVAVFVNPADDRFKKYVGKKAKVPLFDLEVPIIADDKAQMDKGTGAVMCCTFGDSTDIAWWRQHKLPLREAISKIGKMTELAGAFAGLKTKEAREKIIAALKEKNLVLKVIEIPAKDRVVNTHERCGTPVEYLVQPQWFIKVCDFKKELIEVGQKIKWTPEHMRYRFENWVENLSWDWAISRQRSFGVPIPAWYSEDGKHIHIADPKDLPIDPLEKMPSVPCPSGQWIPDPDVMDTWATSSVTPLINAKYGLADERKNFLPMSMRPQAHDIIRTWAFYTIAKSYFHFGDMPWRDIVISGHVQKPGAKVEASQMEGQEFARKTKISKSKDGEQFAPDKILERNCADAIRLWTAGVSLGSDTIFDEGAIQEGNKFLNKLWNATRFALMSLEGFTPSSETKILNAEDHWIRGRMKQVLDNYVKSLDLYELHKAKIELDKFFWISFCDNYIEFVKCRAQTGSKQEQQSAYQTVYDILLGLIKLYAPYAPHVTEEIYQLYFKTFEKKESLHELLIADAGELSQEENEAQKTGDFLVAVIGGIRTFKSQKQLGFKVPAELVSIATSAEGVKHLEKVIPIIQNFSSAAKVELKDAVESSWTPTTDSNTSIYMTISSAAAAQ